MHTDGDGTYGRPRMTAELREDGERVNHKRVGRVMRKFGIAGLAAAQTARDHGPGAVHDTGAGPTRARLHRGRAEHQVRRGQYGSRQFADLCGRLGVVWSMGAVGTSADNALAESLNVTLKRETLQGARRFNGAEACHLAVFRGSTWHRQKCGSSLFT